MIGPLFEGLSLLTGSTLLYLTAGITIGIIVGMIPGIGSTLGMAILLPLTIIFEPVDAIILLISIYAGGCYGGSVAAILINTPGTAAAAATTLDGYPLAKKGKAVNALSMSAISSAIGGSIGISIVILISPAVIVLVLLFGSPEYFLVAFLGLAMIPVIIRGPLVKGLISGMFGLLLTTMGISHQTGEPRFTFGEVYLFDGIDFIAVLIGLFAISEMLRLSAKSGTISENSVEISGSILSGFSEIRRNPIALIKGILIGISVGAVPGAGASVSTFVAYGETLRGSNNPDEFGNGSSEGIISAESANNSTVAGSLIPTLSFGIPGSGSTAVLLGGLLMHGLQPGPQLFSDDIQITYAILLALLFGNLIILFVGLTFITRFAKLTAIDTNYIIPMVIVMAVTGSYILRSNWLDVATVAILGIMGYYMKDYDYNIVALVLGSVLGGIMETNLYRSIQISDGSYLIFVSSPTTILLTSFIALILLGPALTNQINKIR